MADYILVRIDDKSGKRSPPQQVRRQSISTLRKGLIKHMDRRNDLYDIHQIQKDGHTKYIGSLFFIGDTPVYRKGLSNKNSDLVDVDPKTGKLRE